ncbi:Qat anti-phage system associated protein QatB [Sphingomonas sp. 67-36]|uniref:Qat anti-phage system associated protein QatB n=1 Tax=Sphingomonas sp. 67-36 TaxID=1895849 RepID=UPI0009267C65|nr:MAG: hypothetical protein BGO24_17960 [Sphingomonas sp. 67-36]
MGTSASSRGPGSGPDIPIVPPWVDNPPAQQPVPQPTQPTPAPAQPPTSPSPHTPPPPNPQVSQPPEPQPQPQPEPSTPGRWRGVRTSLGKFGSGGDDRGRHLRRGLGHYSRSGMGGSRNAARRMAGSARTASVLHSALSALASGEALPQELGIDPQALVGLSTSEFIDTLVDAIRPFDGTQDAEATRDSVARALSDILDQNVDITSLTPQQVDQVTASTLGYDVALRVELDVGKSIIAKAPTKGDGLERLQEMKDYVREVVAAEYAAERAKVGTVGRAAIDRISRNAIQQAFEVFEEDGGL